MSEMFTRVMAAIRAEQDRRNALGNCGMTDAEAFTRVAIDAMHSPGDNILLAAGQLYDGKVPRDLGIAMRRNAWNKMIDEILK